MSAAASVQVTPYAHTLWLACRRLISWLPALCFWLFAAFLLVLLLRTAMGPSAEELEMARERAHVMAEWDIEGDIEHEGMLREARKELLRALEDAVYDYDYDDDGRPCLACNG